MTLGRGGSTICSRNTCFLSDCLPPCSRFLLQGNRVQFLVKILHGLLSTEERAASWPSVEPESDWVLVVSAIDRFDKDVVKRTIGVLDVKIAGVDTGVIGGRIALNSLKPTGTLSILSAAGAVSATVRSTARKISLFMIIYLSIFPTTSNIGFSSSTLKPSTLNQN